MLTKNHKQNKTIQKQINAKNKIFAKTDSLKQTEQTARKWESKTILDSVVGEPLK